MSADTPAPEHVWTAENIDGPWSEFYKVAATRMRRMDGPFTVRTDEGEVTCADGWLAVDSRGYPYPINVDEQAAIYRSLAEADVERLRTLFAEKVAAQVAVRRCVEALMTFQANVNTMVTDLSPDIDSAMQAHPDPSAASTRGAVEQVERLAQFFLDEHPELISGGSVADTAIAAISSTHGDTATVEMLRAVRDNLVIHSTQTGRVGWAGPHETVRQHRFRYLAQNAVKPWSEVERGALIEALNAGLIAIDHTRVVLTNGGRAALGLVPLDEQGEGPINAGLAEPGKLG